MSSDPAEEEFRPSRRRIHADPAEEESMQTKQKMSSDPAEENFGPRRRRVQTQQKKEFRPRRRRVQTQQKESSDPAEERVQTPQKKSSDPTEERFRPSRRKVQAQHGGVIKDEQDRREKVSEDIIHTGKPTPGSVYGIGSCQVRSDYASRGSHLRPVTT
ncbi:hypothetical protein BaRGS_00014915, partial [Batillaria attramentaria]